MENWKLDVLLKRIQVSFSETTVQARFVHPQHWAFSLPNVHPQHLSQDPTTSQKGKKQLDFYWGQRGPEEPNGASGAVVQAFVWYFSTLFGPLAGLFQAPSCFYFDLSWASWASWQWQLIQEHLLPRSHAWRWPQCAPPHPSGLSFQPVDGFI